MLAFAQLMNLTVFILILKTFRRLRKLSIDVAAHEVLVALLYRPVIPHGTIITIVVSTTSPRISHMPMHCRIWLPGCRPTLLVIR